VRGAVALLVIAACSGKPVRAPKDASGSAIAVDARASDAGGSGGSGSGSGSVKPTTGEIRARVEWANVPVAARAAAGKTACKTPRAPSVQPTTTWGIPNAVVIVSGAAPAATRIVLADCALSPSVALGGRLVVASAVSRPARVAFGKRGDVATLATLGAGTPLPIMLPIAGHEVDLALEPGGVYAVETSLEPGSSSNPTSLEPELAWIVASRGAITDAAGVALITGLPPGDHQLVAWLPPRANQPGRIARGTATVVAGDVVDLTLDLAATP